VKKLNTIPKAGQSGFTLIEILLVMLITSILVLGIRAAFSQAHLLCSKIENHRPIYQQSRLVIETMRQELACLYFPKGSEDEQLIPFSLSSLSDGTIQLSFYTLNPAWNTSSRFSHSARVSYKFSNNSQTEQRILVRAEQICSGEKTLFTQNEEVILHGLSKFNVWALDPNSDFAPDSWKGNLECKTTPPKTVKIQLKWPQNNNQEEHDFQTTITIPCQSHLPP